MSERGIPSEELFNLALREAALCLLKENGLDSSSPLVEKVIDGLKNWQADTNPINSFRKAVLWIDLQSRAGRILYSRLKKERELSVERG